MQLKLKVQEVARTKGVGNQTQLQTRAGLTAPLAGRYWKGDVQSVSLEHLAKIAQALGVSAKDLLEEVPARSGECVECERLAPVLTEGGYCEACVMQGIIDRRTQ